MSILLLPPNHTDDDSAIWRAAIARGMKTLRCQQPDRYADELVTIDLDDVFYYGNTLHSARVRESGLKLRVKMLDPNWITAPVIGNALGRWATAMTFEQFERLPEGREVFVKCAHEKWFKPVVTASRVIPGNACQPHDILHVQDVVTFSDEVRCWVVDGRILTWAYYRKNGKTWRDGITAETDEPLSEWCALVALIAPALPRAVVIDVGMIENSRRWHVIEANEPWASGIYDCDPAACLQVILENQRVENTA